MTTWTSEELNKIRTAEELLYIISAAMVVLLFLGIRNAWDLVTFLAVERSRPENKSREKRRSGSSSLEKRMPK